MGKTIAAKWTNLMSRISSPWGILVSPYRYDRLYWIMWQYSVRVLVMFASGTHSLKVFAILSSLLHGLYLLTLIIFKPHLSSLNSAYDLFLTLLSFAFPIAYANLKPNQAYAIAFPVTALVIGIVVILLGLIYEYYRKRQSKSQSLNEGENELDDQIPGGCNGCVFLENGVEKVGQHVWMHEIDFRDLDEVESDEWKDDLGCEIITDAQQLHRFTSDIMESISLVSTEADIWHTIVWIGWWVAAIGFACAGWYLGAVIGTHTERLSVDC
jgi:NADH:ubiquinone oxidoreductase subunit K